MAGGGPAAAADLLIAITPIPRPIKVTQPAMSHQKSLVSFVFLPLPPLSGILNCCPLCRTTPVSTAVKHASHSHAKNGVDSIRADPLTNANKLYISLSPKPVQCFVKLLRTSFLNSRLQLSNSSPPLPAVAASVHATEHAVQEPAT